ncbi:hypothetical protein [Bacteroides sp. 51]|uniref:hypothetical protein n=1 Tax=Bacteroides sp. 51 TaxID=2302938 RepID=UPI0013D0B61E|nr:hypothetical protein [Bacteroides sp. 51]NDV81815.1 hypothetical protein [Bacteroides sp. 51]
MSNLIKRQALVLIVGLIATFSSFAQTYYWYETIDTVSALGYYNIELSQEIAGVGLNSLLILDDDDKEVPYLIRSSVPVKEMKQMEMYELVSNVHKDSINTIIVHNREAEVSRFYLRMKEAEVTKYISIRGSYDRKQWFSVKQKSLLYSEHNPNLGEIAIIDFPKGDYTYYELAITNNSRSPLNITGVGKIEKSSIYGQFVELKPGSFVVKEDRGNTIITFPSLEYPYYLSKFELQITGKGHYNRRMWLESSEKIEYTVGAFQLSSRDEHTFYTDQVLIDKNTQIVIENESNPSLTVDGIKLFGVNRYLCAYLDAGMQYRIEAGLKRPGRYDIQDFANEISLHLPIVKTVGLQKKMIEKEPERELRFFESPLFLWGVIALTGLILLFICLRMLKELKKKS